MRQRLGLADALVKYPSILILDEPTVNIDPEGVRELLELVDRLSDEQGVTVILSSHLLHQVEQVCDRIGIFVKGRLVALGTVEELATDLDQWVFAVGVDGIADPANALAGVPGVVDVRPADGRLVVVASRDVRSDVHQSSPIAAAPTHLARQGADLDAIYHRHFHEAGESRG